MKHQEVSLRDFGTVSVALKPLGRYFDVHKRRCPHSTLDGKIIDMAYFNQPPLAPAA